MSLKQVLVIDDEPPILALFRKIIEPMGCGVHTAASGVEGLELIGKGTYDVIFLDLNMPDASGIETLKEIRLRDADVPIYIVTGFYDRYVGQLQEISRKTCVSFEILHKPVDWNVIRAIIEGL